MSTKVKIKICGITSFSEIEFINALDILPDYIGFVFAESKRKVTPQMSAKLREGLSSSISTVGVFRENDIATDEGIEGVVSLVKGGIIDMVQLHSCDDDMERTENIEIFGKVEKLSSKISVPIIIAFSGERYTGFKPGDARLDLIDYILLDSKNPGSGKAFDWSGLKGVDTSPKPIFLAGGLTPENVGKAIRAVNPFAVDVSSGVEIDGKKSPHLVRGFIDKSTKSMGIAGLRQKLL